MHPADRQNFTRWYTTVRRGESTRVPGYLEEGLGYAEQLGTELIMAFNLDHVVSRTRVMERIRGSELLRKHSLVDTEVAKLLASVRGLSFGATVRDQIYGSVKIDFNEDISSLKPITEQLVQDVMEITGAHIDEFDEWKPVIDGKQLSMQGPLSKASFRLIMSLMPSPEHEATTPVDTEAGSGPAAATKRYFDSVNRMFDDLRRKLTPGQPYTRNATWMRKSADKIDGLPLANVDEQMLDYGNFVSGTIRNQALGLIESRETTKQSINTLIASGARSGGGGGSRWGGGSGRYGYNRIGRRGGWGYRRGGDGSRLRNATRSNIQSAAIESVAEVFTDIETTRGQVRQSMSAKYGMDF